MDQQVSLTVTTAAVVCAAAVAAAYVIVTRVSLEGLSNENKRQKKVVKDAKDKESVQSFDFQSFLIDPNLQKKMVEKTKEKQNDETNEKKTITLPAVLILYGTATGYSQEIAENMKSRIKEKIMSDEHKIVNSHDKLENDSMILVSNMREFSKGIEWLHLVPFLIVAISTQGKRVLDDLI